jgi:hypothetical protein
MCAMSPRLLRPVASGFNPKTIANLTGWYDATDSSSYTESSGQISEWRDKSGSGNAVTQSTANNRPTLFESSGNVQGATQSVINGRQSLFFDGVNDLLETSNTVTSGQSRTVFAVARRTDNNSVTHLAMFGEIASSGAFRWLVRYGSSASPHVGGDAVATNQTLSAGVQAGWTSPHIACWSQNSSTRNLSYFLNGSSLAITGNPPTAQTIFAGFFIGNARSGSLFNHFNGHLGEMLVYNRELTQSERDKVTAALSKKWGITVT